MSKKKFQGHQFQGHQGDVFFERVDSMPENLPEVPAKAGRIILALGEVTGHAHAISPVAGVMPAKLYDAGFEKFLKVTLTCKLEHEEHAPITFNPGIYKIPYFNGGTQREYHPQEIRRVAD